MSHARLDPSCAMAHGQLPPENSPRVLVTVFASPVSDWLLRLGRDVGFRTVLLDPDSGLLAEADWTYADHVTTVASDEFVDRGTDVVLTDHDRPELGRVLESFLRLPARWIGVMGSNRHPAPHIPALRELNVPEPVIGRVHRPVGLNIGSRSPAEIAVSILAGLIASRNRRPGGFVF